MPVLSSYPSRTLTKITGVDVSGNVGYMDQSQGSWTPELKYNNANVGMTYTARPASYIRIGKLIFITAHIQVANNGSSSGNATITGLPFANNATVAATFPIQVDAAQNISANELPHFHGILNASASVIRITGNFEGDVFEFQESQLNDGVIIWVSGSYISA